ncbi:DUF4271 domain-containing protein [Flavobacterium sp.]
MIELIMNPRIVEPKDWVTLLFVFSLVLIAVTRTAFETRFNEFLRILISDKYIKVYKDSSHLMSGFTVLLFIVQIIAVSLFIQIVLDHYGYVSKYDWISFLRTATFFSVFVLSKYLIEKIIGTTFNFEEFVEQYNLLKVSYRTFLSIVLLPVSVFLFYNKYYADSLIYFIIAIILIINILTYLVSLKNYQNLIIGNMFYFILYLCALEIAPYYFIYYLITKL